MSNKFTWSKYQQDIFHRALDPDGGSFCIEAAAGSGKSTVIEEIARRLSAQYPDKKILMLAFNKSIADKLKTEMTEYPNVVCKTAHSFGLSVLARSGLKFKVDENKWKDYIVKNLKTLSNNENFENFKKRTYIGNCLTLFDLCRATLMRRSKTMITQLADACGIMFVHNEDEAVCKMLQDATNLHKFKVKENGITHIKIDFSDMIYLAVSDTFRGKIPKYSFVMCDEAQDLTGAQHQLIMNALAKSGKIIPVGDSKQSIYFFATGSANTFDRFKELCGGLTLPLSVCYRCGKNIIKEAQKINPAIEWAENAIDGEVRWQYSIEGVGNGDMILCRKNAPLIKVALKLMANGKAAFVKGLDIAENLKNVLSRVNEKIGLFDDSKTHLQDGLKQYLQDIVTYLEKKGAYNPTSHPVYLQALEDIDSIYALSKYCNKISEIFELIDKVFADIEKGDAIMLSTVHKAKGLEADNVYIICPEILPMRKENMTKVQMMQEDNLAYVAVTRGKKLVVYVNATERDCNDILMNEPKENLLNE